MIEHPEILNKIPSRSTMVFLPEYDRKLYAANVKLARQRMSAGDKIVFIRLKKLASPKSRIIRPRVEYAESA
jgi:hypothetical protein